MALPINDIAFEEQRPYPGSVQDNCKHVHHGQTHSADTTEPARRTPDDPVDLLHPAVSSDRAAEFKILTERDKLKPACMKKNIPLHKYAKIPKKSPGIACTCIDKIADEGMKETGSPKLWMNAPPQTPFSAYAWVITCRESAGILQST